MKKTKPGQRAPTLPAYNINITEIVYNMSIELTTKVLSLQNLSQSEKHVLTILCFRANQYKEVYSSIERLSLECSCSIKTIERSLKKLRDKNYLLYTGKLAPNSKSIPIYCINLTHGQNGGELNLRTDNLSLTDGQIGDLRTDKMGIGKGNINKDNRKDIVSPLTTDQIKRYKKEKQLQDEKLK